MSPENSSKATRDTVAKMAAESFACHALAWDEDTRVWTCRSPKSWTYGFHLFFAPGMAVMWGDLGEFVWRHADVDALDWFLSQGGKDGDYPDYFLGKLRACDGSTKVFFPDDAEQYLRDYITEDPDNKCWPVMLERFVDARVEAGENLEEVWHREWHDVVGDESPSCREWSASALRAWYAARTFARLHDEYIAAQRQVRSV